MMGCLDVPVSCSMNTVFGYMQYDVIFIRSNWAGRNDRLTPLACANRSLVTQHIVTCFVSSFLRIYF